METLLETNFDSEVKMVITRLEHFSDRVMNKPNVDKGAVLRKLMKIAHDKFHHRVYVYGMYILEKEKNMNLRDGKYSWSMLGDIEEQKRIHGLSFDAAFIKLTRNAADNERKQINKQIATLKGYLDYSARLSQLNGNPQMLKARNQIQSKEQASVQETQSTGCLLKDVFRDEESYLRIMNTLVEKQYCMKGLMDLYTWINKERGYKTQICTVLHLLNSKGYFKQRYSDSKLLEIVRNTFGLKITLRTFQNKEQIHALTTRFAFIG